MTFEARSRETIAREMLARLAARYEREGEKLDTRVGSPAWLRAQGLAAILESLDMQAAGADDQILPDRAVGLHLAAHADLAEVPRAGDDDEAWRQRVLAWWRASMAPMGSDDWVALLESHPDIEHAFVYPGVDPEDAATVDVPGCTTLVVMGAAQGDSPTPPNAVSLDELHAWLAGEVDENGDAIEGAEQRPICAHPDSVRLITLAESTFTLEVSVENDAAHAFPWHGSMTIWGIDATSVEVSGDHTDKVGLPMLVPATAASQVSPVRGGDVRVVPTAASYNGGTGRTTFTIPAGIFQAPFTYSGTVNPCPRNWQLLRLAIFALLDSLGPGDTSPSRRYPAPDAAMPSTLYPAAIRAAALGVEGVLNATTNRGAPRTPAAWTYNSVTTLRILEI